jgi:hypothetical protein
MSRQPELPGSAELFESQGYIGGVVNPFESIPYPNAIRVGLASEEYPRDDNEAVGYMEIENDGTASLYVDPLNHPVAVFNPEHLALFEFLCAHFTHYEKSWKELPLKNRRVAMHSFPRDEKE